MSKKSLLTTLNEEDQPNLLYVEGGGEEYEGISPIYVDNGVYKISFRENECTGITTLSANVSEISGNLNTVSSDLTTFHNTYDSFTANLNNIYVQQSTYNTYTGNINQTINTITGNINTINGEINTINDTLNDLSTLVDTKANQTDLNNLSVQVDTNTTAINSLTNDVTGLQDLTSQIQRNLNDAIEDINDLNDSVNTITSNIDTLNGITTQLRNDLDDVDDAVTQLVSAVDDINEELQNKISYTALNYDSIETPTYISGINTYPIEIPGVTKNIVMYDGANRIALNTLDDDYTKAIPFASADNQDLGISGTPGVISKDDKSKLDNIVIYNSDSANMQLTYVGYNNDISASTFLGYSGGTLGFYDLNNYTVEEAIDNPSIMEDENNWSEHPFGLTPELKALSDLLADSANHPNAVLGTTTTESGRSFGWIDLG